MRYCHGKIEICPCIHPPEPGLNWITECVPWWWMRNWNERGNCVSCDFEAKKNMFWIYFRNIIFSGDNQNVGKRQCQYLCFSTKPLKLRRWRCSSQHLNIGTRAVNGPSQSQRKKPLLGPSPSWKLLRHHAKQVPIATVRRHGKPKQLSHGTRRFKTQPFATQCLFSKVSYVKAQVGASRGLLCDCENFAEDDTASEHLNTRCGDGRWRRYRNCHTRWWRDSCWHTHNIVTQQGGPATVWDWVSLFSVGFPVNLGFVWKIKQSLEIYTHSLIIM